MRVVADSHALVWFAQDSSRLSGHARETMTNAESSEGIVVSAATLIDLWYVTQTTEAIREEALTELRLIIDESDGITLQPIDADIADSYATISRDVMRDPWDRLIVATALTFDLPLVTKDGLIRKSGLVPVIW